MQTDVQYHSAAVYLVNHFDEGFEAAGLTRGCPDFIFTVLTYGVVSLLKILSVPVSGFETITQSIIDLARRASDILARAAVTRDHLPAAQSSLVSRLIEKARNASARVEPATFDLNQIISEITSAAAPATTTTSGGPGSDNPSMHVAQSGQLHQIFDHPADDGAHSLSNNPDANSWFEPLQFNPLVPSDPTVDFDPFGQDQELLFSHESMW